MFKLSRHPSMRGKTCAINRKRPNGHPSMRKKTCAINRKHKAELGLITVIFVIAAFLVYKTTILPRMVLPHMQTQVEADEGALLMLSDGDHIEQTFRYPSDELLSIGFQISLNEKKVKDLFFEDEDNELGTLHLEVLRQDGTSLMRSDYPVYLLEDEQNLLASFAGAEQGFKDQTLTIVLDVENIREDVDLAIGYSSEEVLGAELTVNGKRMECTLNVQSADHQFFYWKTWALFGAAVIYVLLVGTYLLLAVVRLRPEKVFLFSGSVLAFLYLLLLPPLAVPDEWAHFKEAYYYSNLIMGKEEADPELVTLDAEDFRALQVFETTPSLTEYDTLKENIGKGGRISGEKVIKRSDTQAPAVTYLPGIVGIILGRILGLNGFLVIYLGRICSILCYLFMMYWFIRLMPRGKPAAFIMAILPMTIQQCCSYSYDSVVIEVAFVYIAIVFGLFYEKKAIQKWQIVLYAFCMVLLSICKGGTYMPMCLLTLLIPVSRFGDKKKKWIFVGSMACIAVAAFLTSTLSYVLYVASPTAEQAAGSYLKGEAYGAAGLLADPMTFICLSVRTLFSSGDGFLETMLGMQLGWLNVFVSRIVIYGMLLLMILSVLPIENGTKRREFGVTMVQKISYLVVIMLSAAMVFASMFMSWTPKNSIEIAGIQGRYFLPLLPLFLMLFSSRNVTLKKDIGRKSMFLAVCLQCIAIYGILMSLERIL